MVKALVAREAAANCTEVAILAVALATLVLEFPGSPDVLVFSATIIASNAVDCTVDEKTALVAGDEKLDEAVGFLDDALDSAQSQLMTLTGVTASPEDIAEAVATLIIRVCNKY